MAGLAASPANAVLAQVESRGFAAEHQCALAEVVEAVEERLADCEQIAVAASEREAANQDVEAARFGRVAASVVRSASWTIRALFQSTTSSSS